MSKVSQAGVQQQYVQIREILDDVLCLFSATSPTRRVYRAVLEVSTIYFLLKAEEEQEALIARYRAMLKSLTFPLQILIRNQRLDVQPYLDRVQQHTPSLSTGHRWQDLAQSLQDLVADLSDQRTLIERHCYLVIPAPDLLGSSPRPRFLQERRRAALQGELLTRALQELDVRVDMLAQQLAALGLRVTRLRGERLATLYHSCLTPERALRHPLLPFHLAAVGRLPRVLTSFGETGVSLPSFPPFPHAMPGSAQQVFADGAETQRVFPHAAASRRQRMRFWQKRQASPRKTPASTASTSLPSSDFLRLTDLLAPGSLEEGRHALRIAEEWVRGIVVTAFPREVAMSAWLAPLIMHDEVLEIVFHLHPQEQARVMRRLKQRRAGYASTCLFNRRQGKLDDPEMDVAQHDVSRLLGLLASGEERLFEVSLLLLVRARDRSALDENTERVLAKLQTIFLDAVAHQTTFEHGPAFRSFLPECRDELRRTITLDSTTVATTFPFLSNSLTMPGGAFLGMTGSGEPVMLDPWDTSLENPHAFIAGVTGAGKSYLGKLWLERSLLIGGPQSEHFSVIDLDSEYYPLAQALGGAIVRLAPGSRHMLNPFDLVPPGCPLEQYLAEVQHGDRLAEKIQDFLSLLGLMLADAGTVLGQRERALLDRALYETYRRVGITADPHTHARQSPLLRDLYEVLKSTVCGPDETGLALRLSRYIEGSLASVFAHPTNVPLDAHVLVWDIRDMRDELRPIGIFLIADHIWTQALYQSRTRRCLAIDEAASILEHPEGGAFLANLSRRARKRYVRLIVMTQNPERFVEDPSGGVVAANAAIKILKLQDRTSVQAVRQRFGLTDRETQRLLAFGVHEALLLVGDRRVLLATHASASEHALITTNPAELAQRAAPPSFPVVSTISPSSPPPHFLTEVARNEVQNAPAAAPVYDPAYGFFPEPEAWRNLPQ